MDIQPLIDIAVIEAQKSSYQHRIAAILFRKRNILAISHNHALRSRKHLHPRFQKWHGSVHAEVDTIIKARTDVKGSTILVVRINRKNQLRMAKPCDFCMSYIIWVGIKRVIYSTGNKQSPFEEIKIDGTKRCLQNTTG